MRLRAIWGLVFIILGIVLLIFGLNASQAPLEKAIETMTGKYTKETMIYLLGGIGLVVVGAFMAFARKSGGGSR